MRKLWSIGVLSVALLSGLTGGAAVAQDPGWVPTYSIIYYSDATHFVQVGIDWGTCSIYGPGTNPGGVYTDYSELVLTAYCDEHGNMRHL